MGSVYLKAISSPTKPLAAALHIDAAVWTVLQDGAAINVFCEASAEHTKAREARAEKEAAMEAKIAELERLVAAQDNDSGWGSDNDATEAFLAGQRGGRV